MNKKIRIVSFSALVAVLCLSFLVSCASAPDPRLSSNGTQTAAGYRIKFYQKEKEVASLGLTDLHTLPEVTFTMSGKSETGPALLSVLKLAGIKDFSTIKVTGMLKGRLATGELTLNSGDVTGQVILSFNNQGKTKLCGTQIPDSNWIIDVAEIRAE
jgi:hypothetical protein